MQLLVREIRRNNVERCFPSVERDCPGDGKKILGIVRRVPAASTRSQMCVLDPLDVLDALCSLALGAVRPSGASGPCVGT